MRTWKWLNWRFLSFFLSLSRSFCLCLSVCLSFSWVHSVCLRSERFLGWLAGWLMPFLIFDNGTGPIPNGFRVVKSHFSFQFYYSHWRIDRQWFMYTHCNPCFAILNIKQWCDHRPHFQATKSESSKWFGSFWGSIACVSEWLCPHPIEHILLWIFQNRMTQLITVAVERYFVYHRNSYSSNCFINIGVTFYSKRIMCSMCLCWCLHTFSTRLQSVAPFFAGIAPTK